MFDEIRERGSGTVRGDFDDFDEIFYDLAPRGTRKNYAPPKKRDTDTSEVVSGGTEKRTEGFRIPPAGRDVPARQIRTSRYSGASFDRRPREKITEEVLKEYTVNGEFIKKVTVKSWPVGHGFYEKFARDAILSHQKRGSRAPHVPFFSYIPQYSQLNAAQWAYYLYMKECARAGVCLADADFSYVILYIYEIINLEGTVTPEEGGILLAAVWSLYRRIHPMLDKYMSEWMADYCLMYALPMPKVLLPIIAEIARGSTVKEYYAEAALKNAPGEMGRLLRASLSDYDPMRSRYASKYENFASLTEEVFDSAASEQSSDMSGVFSESYRRRMTVTRDAFCGSLCASSVKKKIVLELDTPFRSPDTRRAVTEMMKGAENIVRSRLGVKARLAAPALAGKSAAVIARTEEERAYLSFYESPAEELSCDAAYRIESDSWRNTELLTAEELAEADECDVVSVEGALSGGDDEPCEKMEFLPQETENITSEGDSLSAVLGESLYTLLRTAADGGSFAAACRNAGVFADDAARRINEFAMDIIGDVVLESDGTDYVFVEDYREDID